MNLLEDMEPEELLAELRQMDDELRRRAKIMNLLSGRIAFARTMLKGRYPKEVLDEHCAFEDEDCLKPVAFSVYHPGHWPEDESTHAYVCEDHCPHGGMGTTIQPLRKKS